MCPVVCTVHCTCGDHCTVQALLCSVAAQLYTGWRGGETQTAAPAAHLSPNTGVGVRLILRSVEVELKG